MSAFDVLKEAAAYGVVVCLEGEKVKLAAPEKPPQRLLKSCARISRKLSSICNGTARATFAHQHEGLDGHPDACPL